MPGITTTIRFLADIELYQREKPYYIFWPADGSGNRSIATSNIHYEDQENIRVHDIREQVGSIGLEESGFEILQHVTNVPLPISNIEEIEAYKRETEQTLKKRFGALEVYCYEARVRCPI